MDIRQEKVRLLNAQPFNIDRYERRIASRHNDDNEERYLGDVDSDVFVGDNRTGYPLSPTRSDSPTESVSSVATEPSNWHHG